MTIDSGADILCPACGYDLRAIQSQRCPECGTEIDRAALRDSLIPWTNRRRFGNVRAFLKTVALSIRRPWLIAREPENAVDLRAGKLFALIVVLCATVPLCIWAVALQIATRDGFIQAVNNSLGFYGSPTPTAFPPMLDPMLCWVAYCTAAPYFTPLILLFMVKALAGVASYWFHPRGLERAKQNRAIALSYYACGPLALAFVPVSLGALAAVKRIFYPLEAPTTRFPIFDLYYLSNLFLPTLVIVGIVLVPGAWLRATLRVLKGTTDASNERVAGVAVALPLVWLAIVALFVVVIPVVLGLILLAVQSYRP